MKHQADHRSVSAEMDISTSQRSPEAGAPVAAGTGIFALAAFAAYVFLPLFS